MTPHSGIRPYALGALVWCLAALVIKPFYPYLDFGVFYATAMDLILAGRPLDIYSFVAHPPGSDLSIPLTYPPHVFLLLAPFYGLGRLLGLADFHTSAGFSLGQAWMLLPTLPFDLLLCRELVRLAERQSGPLPEPQRQRLFFCVLLSPVLWLSSVRFGHYESMMLAMVLLAVGEAEKGRTRIAGLFWGLAIAVKTTAVAPALVWAVWGIRRGGRRQVLTSLAIGAAVVVVPVLPYLLLRFEPTWHALVGFEAVRPVGGYSLWKIMSFPQWLSDASAFLILLGAGALGWALARRDASSFLEAGGACALVLSQVLLLLLGKAVFIWYGLALVVFTYLAFPRPIIRQRSLPLVALTVSLLAWLLQSGAWAGTAVTPAIRVRSALWVVFLLAVGGLAAWGLKSRSATRQACLDPGELQSRA